MFNDGEDDDYIRELLRQQDLQAMRHEHGDEKLVPRAVVAVILILFYVPTAQFIVTGFQFAYIYLLFRFGIWLIDGHEMRMWRRELVALERSDL